MKHEFNTPCGRFFMAQGLPENSALRTSFNSLSKKVFGLDFEPWYKMGGWTFRFVPHALVWEGQIVANVSVNHMRFSTPFGEREFLQLGTVMCDEAFRGRGLVRFLLEEILNEWKGKCSGIYLFANDSVLNFYPRFGFERVRQFCVQAEVERVSGPLRKMNMEDPADRQLLAACYEKGNPFSEWNLVDNFPLLLFYCAQFLKDRVFELPGTGLCAVLGEEEGSCCDFFGETALSQAEALGRLFGKAGSPVTLLYPPLKKEGLSSFQQKGDVLFWLSTKGALSGCPPCFSPLTHT